MSYDTAAPPLLSLTYRVKFDQLILPLLNGLRNDTGKGFDDSR